MVDVRDRVRVGVDHDQNESGVTRNGKDPA